MRLHTLAIVAIGAVGCSASLDGALPPGTRVALHRLRSDASSFTYFSSLQQPERLVIRGAAAWRTAWASIWPNGAPIAAPPDVDFTKDMVVLGALGTRPSSGFAIRFDSAATNTDGITIWVATIRPGPHCGTATVLTQPVDIATLARIDGAVHFVDVPTVIDC
jgi:PrcB C-terminal